MRPAFNGESTTGPAGPVAYWVGLLLLFGAPIIRGGNRHVALIILEWLGLLLLLALALQWVATVRHRAQPPVADVQAPSGFVVPGVSILFLALSPLWVGLVQLIPLPASLWAALPGREVYVDALAVAQAPASVLRPLSLTPDATWLGVLAGIPLAAAFLLAYTCTFRQLTLLTRALVVFALVQAVLGLLQLGPFPALYFDAAAGVRAIGSFANPNHFANYLAMSLPLAILMLRQANASEPRNKGAHGHRASAGPLWGLGLFLLLAAVLASNSRGGTTTALVVALLAVILLPLRDRHRHPQARRWGLAAAAALLVLVVLAVGLDALISRFEGDKVGYLAGDRWQYVTSTWRAGLTFWPAGSGLGSFAAVFPAFQPAGIRGFVEFAHNDYVELLMECGALFVVLATLAAVLIARQAARLVHRARAARLDAAVLLQASCGLGLLAILLHSWVDFNLRIPANAITASFLLGAFLRPLVDRPPTSRSGPAPSS